MVSKPTLRTQRMLDLFDAGTKPQDIAKLLSVTPHNVYRVLSHYDRHVRARPDAVKVRLENTKTMHLDGLSATQIAELQGRCRESVSRDLSSLKLTVASRGLVTYEFWKEHLAKEVA